MNPEPNTIPEPSSHFLPDAVAVELAVRFLESDPGFASADEIKEQLAIELETARFTGEQRNRLAAVLLRALRHGSELVFRSYARLAPAVTSPLFEAALTCYAASCEYPVSDRAKHLVSVVHSYRASIVRRPGAPAPRASPPIRRCLHVERC